jgi:hypothetical protein
MDGSIQVKSILEISWFYGGPVGSIERLSIKASGEMEYDRGGDVERACLTAKEEREILAALAEPAFLAALASAGSSESEIIADESQVSFWIAGKTPLSGRFPLTKMVRSTSRKALPELVSALPSEVESFLVVVKALIQQRFRSES